MSREWVDLRIATYNIHRSRGLDRRTRPSRIAAVLADLEPDIAALQEVVGPGLDGPGHIEEIGAALGMGWVMAPAREHRSHQFGNAVLSRFPVREHAQHDLTWKTCEPRCGQRVAVDLGGRGLLQIYNVHLGTALLERRYQAPRLAGWIHDRRVSVPKLVLGDFNEWARRGIVAAALERRLQSLDLYGHLRRRRTYPGFFPLVHLDHIYFEGEVAIRRITMPRTRLALVASDHLPLVADIRVRF
jgi:endonuclease/exonuclease/phosphatase family metal-dependent hydrolase